MVNYLPSQNPKRLFWSSECKKVLKSGIRNQKWESNQSREKNSLSKSENKSWKQIKLSKLESKISFEIRNRNQSPKSKLEVKVQCQSFVARINMRFLNKNWLSKATSINKDNKILRSCHDDKTLFDWIQKKPTPHENFSAQIFTLNNDFRKAVTFLNGYNGIFYLTEPKDNIFYSQKGLQMEYFTKPDGNYRKNALKR